MPDSWENFRNISKSFKDFSALGIATIGGGVISGLFWLYLASILGTKAYGEINYILAIAGVASIISFMGAGNTLVVYRAKQVNIQATMYFIAIVSSLVTSVVLFLFFQNYGASVYVIGYVIFALATSELLGRKMYKTYSKYLLIQRGLMIIFAIGLYFLIGNQGVVLGITLSYFPLLYHIIRGFREVRIDFNLVRSRFGFVINSYILDLSRIFTGSIDKIIIAPLFGFVLLGNYQLGVQFLALMTILPTVVYQYALPQDASGKSTTKIKKGTVGISAIIGILGVFLAPYILPLFFPAFTEAVKILQIVSLAIIPISINMMYTSKFLAHEKNRIVVIGSGIYIGVQIVSILVLGNIYGVSGIATALVIAAFCETLYLTNIEKILKIRMNKI